MKREPFVEPVPWCYRLMMDTGVVILGLVWWLLIPYFAYAQWRQRRRDAAPGYFPERYNEPRRPTSPTGRCPTDGRLYAPWRGDQDAAADSPASGP
jgi:hypothetical protein